MHMAVDDTRHQELSTEVGHLALVLRKAGFVAYINEFAIFYHQRTCLRVGLVRCKDVCVFDNKICFHVIIIKIKQLRHIIIGQEIGPLPVHDLDIGFLSRMDVVFVEHHDLLIL